MRALAVGREVIARCAASVQADIQDAAAADVAREFAGVLEMLDETIRIEGVSIEEDGFGSDSRT